MADLIQTGAEVQELLNKIPDLEKLIGSHNKELKFFAIEPVTVRVGEVEHQCAANEVATVFVGDEEFEVIPTSNNSIQSLLSYPIPLTWYDWLDGVEVFNNIVFDMNELDTYKHWIQYYQGDYRVQKAQYVNCVFWSDKPYTHSPFEERTNYTIYYSAQLPLCYSTIPANTYKPFYLAYGVNTDPNWQNPDYVASYAAVSGATQTFSYYGANAVGIFDMAVDIITLPKDCRGLMYHAPALSHAGVFDAANTTNFGAKKGSWQEAFGDCYSLEDLFIQNLKASINISWSPINNESMAFIVENAANTSAITISVSPYTYYRLTDEIKAAATAKNITIALIEGNLPDDRRWDSKVDKVEGKQLTTEDFTASLKEKLEGLSNYDDTAISEAVNTLRQDFDTLVSGDSTTAIKTFNEIIAFLSGIEDSESLDSIIASIEQQIAAKQDTIADLATIREGAAKGATALQSIPEEYVTEDALATVATTGNYSDLNDKPNVHIIDLTGDAASVHSQITEAYNTENPIFFSRPPGIFGPDYYPCKVEDLVDYFNVYMSLVRSPGSITISWYNVFPTEIVKANVAEIAIANNLNSDGSWNILELSMIGDGTQVLANNGSYTALKSINGTSLLGSGDIEVGGDRSGKLEVVYVTPVISDSTATYTIPAGVLAFCNSYDSATSVVLNLDCSSFSYGEFYQFHIFLSDAYSASLSIGWQGAASSIFRWPNYSAPTLEGSYTTLELSLLGTVYIMDNVPFPYFLAYGAWNRL